MIALLIRHHAKAKHKGALHERLLALLGQSIFIRKRIYNG